MKLAHTRGHAGLHGLVAERASIMVHGGVVATGPLHCFAARWYAVYTRSSHHLGMLSVRDGHISKEAGKMIGERVP